MPVTASVGGTSGAELRYFAAKLRKAAARDLTRVLKRAQRNAVKPLQKEIKTEALASLPKRGGHNATMSKAVKTSVSGGTPGRPLIVRVYARGKVEERDVAAVNAGRLRHPVFGHRGTWKVTRVRPGFVDRPVDKLADKVLEASADEVGQLLEEIARR
jgi:hypothetical protein